MGGIDLDGRDIAILKILQRDNKTPQRGIAGRVNLSAPAVQRRIRRMEAAGVIAANVAVIEPASVGRAITLFVEVEMERARRAVRRRQAPSPPRPRSSNAITSPARRILCWSWLSHKWPITRP